MKRLISLLLFLTLCCAVQASARMNAYIAGSVASAGPTCTTGTDSFTSVAGDASKSSIVADPARGNSFQVTENMNLFSMVFTVSSNGNGGFSCRYGNNDDLSTYYATASASTTDGTRAVAVEFKDTTHALTTGTTYWWACVATSGTITFLRNESGGYANGQMWYGTASPGTWHLNDDISPYDFVFTVRKCTD